MKKRLQNILQFVPYDILNFISCMVVISGMYVSRAMMSMGMIALITLAILNVELPANLKRMREKPHLMVLSGYFVFFLLSWFWSENTGYFIERMQIMIPFLVLPFSFFSMNRWEIKWYDMLMGFFVLLNLCGIVWSIGMYLQNKESFDIGYGYSKLIPTPFKNDHIRYSLAVVMSVCFCVDIFTRYTKTWMRVLLVSVILVDIVYIHILSAKTGIVAFYLAALIFIIRILFSPKFRKLGIASLFVLCTIPFLMYALFPSFKNKIGYFRYSLDQMRNQQKEANISDEGRLISYQYALEIIRAQPLTGVGTGDVLDEMTERYERDFPGKKVTVLLPHNQFLMAGVAMGIPAILFVLTLLILLFRLVRKNDFLYLGFIVVMFFAMMIEPLFETQYGTCIFLFFLLLFMKRSRYHLA